METGSASSKAGPEADRERFDPDDGADRVVKRNVGQGEDAQEREGRCRKKQKRRL
jgi:hypothetical protein